MTIRTASDRSILVSFGSSISLEAHHRVRRLTGNLTGLRGILNLHPAYNSLLVEFDPRLRAHSEIEALIHNSLDPVPPEETVEASRLIEIPVRYGGEYGPDLNDVAHHANMTAERVIELHTSAEYLVYFLGFAPGFAYLGGLPPEIATPRLSAPRKQVPAGSVGIGGSQTGIYPMVSPGGWRLIGRTETALFDPARSEPTLLRMGDRLQFVEVREPA